MSEIPVAETRDVEPLVSTSADSGWRRKLRGRVEWWGLALTVVLVAGWCVGQIARDATWLTGLAFYIPSPFLAGWLPVTAAYGWRRLPRWGTLALLAAAVPPWGVMLWLENPRWFDAPPPTAGMLRLVHWNIGGRLWREDVREVLAAAGGDVYVLSEIPHGPHLDEFRRRLGDGFDAVPFGNLAVAGRGRVDSVGVLVERERVRVQMVMWRYRDRVTGIMVVDLPSEILIARGPLLQEINGLIEEHQPDLVVGDFNAPRRSWGLTELPSGYAHAYETVGAGSGYTWPVPLPMYAIDQCLYSRRVEPGAYRLQSSLLSDHRLQLFEFRMRD